VGNTNVDFKVRPEAHVSPAMNFKVHSKAHVSFGKNRILPLKWLALGKIG